MSARDIFVFGSNLSGRHGRGAALYARTHHSAVDGKGVGRHGNSYAIPTKDHALRPMPLEQIAHYVRQFIEFAAVHPELAFQVTRVGCGLAGYSDQQMVPLFGGARQRIANSHKSGGRSCRAGTVPEKGGVR